MAPLVGRFWCAPHSWSHKTRGSAAYPTRLQAFTGCDTVHCTVVCVASLGWCQAQEWLRLLSFRSASHRHIAAEFTVFPHAIQSPLKSSGVGRVLRDSPEVPPRPRKPRKGNRQGAQGSSRGAHGRAAALNAGPDGAPHRFCVTAGTAAAAAPCSRPPSAGEDAGGHSSSACERCTTPCHGCGAGDGRVTAGAAANTLLRLRREAAERAPRQARVCRLARAQCMPCCISGTPRCSHTLSQRRDHRGAPTRVCLPAASVVRR